LIDSFLFAFGARLYKLCLVVLIFGKGEA
jgi:hypothetical protein